MLRDLRKCSLGLLLVCGGAIAGSVPAAAASTLCVNPRMPGCFSSIGAAVSNATSGDTIEVAHGTYKEDVIIGKPLSLIGENSANTIIDATGLSNGVYIDGLDNPALSHVVVAGFTVANANFEGILVTNASEAEVRDNRLTNNDRSLNVATLTCPGLPDFETAEGFDCGEAVHLLGVDHSLVANNTITANAGGILISDETGASHDNLISGNVIRDNPYDCGITLPSHPPAPSTGATEPFGIYRNTISGNEASGNGLLGEGAGIGLFAFLPFGRVSDNLIIGNRLTNNGLPGVAFHAHAPLENFDNNVIVGNYIAGNAADTDDAATPGPTGINIYGASAMNGTIILQNVIKDEAVDIAVSTPATVSAHQNNLNGSGIGAANLGAGTLDATNNWWGCASGPDAPGCSSPSGQSVQSAPWLSSPAVPNGSPAARR